MNAIARRIRSIAVRTRSCGPVKWFSIIGWLLCSLVFVYLVVPLVVVIPLSFSSVGYKVFPPPGWSLRWYRRLFTDQFWIVGFLKSLEIGVLTAILATVIGTMASFALVRGRFRGKDVLNVLMLAPLIVPSIVVALAVYIFYLDVGLVGTTLGYIAIYTCIVLPMVVLVVSAALVDFDETLERAAMNLGASRLRTYFSVTLPLIAPAMGTAALFAFKTAFDELVIAIFIMGSTPPTLPAHMFYAVEQQGDLTAAAISSIMVTIVMGVLVTSSISRWARERKKGGQAG